MPKREMEVGPKKRLVPAVGVLPSLPKKQLTAESSVTLPAKRSHSIGKVYLLSYTSISAIECLFVYVFVCNERSYKEASDLIDITTLLLTFFIFTFIFPF